MSDIDGPSVPNIQITGRKSGESREEYEFRVTSEQADQELALLRSDPEAYDALIDSQVDRVYKTARTVSRSGRIITLAAMQVPGFATEALSKGGEMAGIIKRDALPEPWDLPDHVGNFFEAGIYTAGAHSILNIVFAKRAGEATQQTAKKAAFGAFAISSAIQIIGEKYVRMGYNTGDMIDAAYGVIYSAGAAAIGFLGITRTEKKVKACVDKGHDIIAKSDERIEQVYGSSRTPKKIHQSAVASQSATKRSTPSHQQRKNARKTQKNSRKKNRR